ncbi:hypothetical protein CAOG_07698 [Capsaspora owczarzaki ATCC 30864]|uniref:tRNA-specific adenosine deaminase 1 n=1 Tax=Capsaspora owczarzaki (strain ATCC 30864) TaxID=595528 RepID=A0A0D2UQH9_CAPO3|nr:hypothetical protein CAOG_07698 [Capsaspora owczarzaki ATCC 30864]KJE97261.1 hypothetical protein CAOG_007698 [Capsaspora owczarzaki ATCC 30864]|eukprot:XP_004343572.1 hypothetical protein CAOG_07698 [Capsaspora owczarzaki ATCC 30864]
MSRKSSQTSSASSPLLLTADAAASPQTVADAVAQVCQQGYARLPPRGKPSQAHLWTVLAGIVVSEPVQRGVALSLVALATGTKCLGASQLARDGTLVNDSHAEVLARRAFRRALVQDMASGKPRWLEPIQATTAGADAGNHHKDADADADGSHTDASSSENGRPNASHTQWKLKPNLSVHLYVNQAPCGDASIFPLDQMDPSERELAAMVYPGNNNPGSGDVVAHAEVVADQQQLHGEKRAHPTENGEADTHGSSTDASSATGATVKRPRLEFSPAAQDIQRTGAKTVADTRMVLGIAPSTDDNVPAPKLDSHEAGADYHVQGCLRTKPGRGDRTRSMSCSDKIALWSCVGLQGALLSQLIPEPIPLATVVVGELFHLEAMQRAVTLRANTAFNELPSVRRLAPPVLARTTERFVDGRLAKLDLARTRGPGAAEQLQSAPSSIVWFSANPSPVFEVLIQGKKEGANSRVPPHKAQSVLSKAAMLQAVEPLLASSSAQASSSTYFLLKQGAADYTARKHAVLATTPFQDWLRNGQSWEEFAASRENEKS